jgi:hypothetical protein
MSHIAIFDKSRAQRLVEAHPCASGCRGDCAQGDRECEFENVRPAEAVSEFAGPDEFESADMEFLADIAVYSLSASVVIFVGVVAWQKLPALFDSLAVAFL